MSLALALIAGAAALAFFIWCAFQLDRPRKKPPRR